MTIIARHRTAISRSFLSRPLQQAFEDGLLDSGASVFDYGCGHGDDVRTLRALGISASGWDPTHRPDKKLRAADVVNLGYVVNVIEDPDERLEALTKSWSLTRLVLVVSARLMWDPDSNIGKPYRDGRITSSGTFQKFYAPEELKAWIESTLERTAVTAAPGVYYVFRENGAAHNLLARHTRNLARPRQGIAELLYEQSEELLGPLENHVREHRRLPDPTDLPAPAEIVESFGSIRAAFAVIRRATGTEHWTDIDLGSRRRSEQRFEGHLDDLQPLIDFVGERGRLPRQGELANETALNSEFGSIRAAFSLIRRVTGPSKWKEFEDEARDNFIVYSALSAFGGRPRFGDLPEDLQYDAKDLFGSYKAACAEADELLYSIADVHSLDAACMDAPFGKITPEALYVHMSALGQLPPLLRVYVGAAKSLTGNVDDATIAKLHRQKPQVSFLIYPYFDRDPHPALQGSLVARLPELRTSYKDFSRSDNPPILHRKETFVPEDYPGREKFARLTRQEEQAGLLDRSGIGRREQWYTLLRDYGYQLRGHRLVART